MIGTPIRMLSFAMTLRLVAVFLVLLSAACGNEETDESGAQSNGCTRSAGNEVLFVGEPRCLATLPRETISGYWVSGHEHSVFYANKQDIPQEITLYPDAKAAWMSLTDEADMSVETKVRAGEWQTFSIKFVGTRSTVKGVYGPGPFKGGVLAERILEIEEIEVREQ